MKFTRFVVPLAVLAVAGLLVLTSSPSGTPSQPAPATPSEQPAENSSSAEATPAAVVSPDPDREFDLSPRYVPGESRRYVVIRNAVADPTPGKENLGSSQEDRAIYVITLTTEAHDESGTTLTLVYDRIRTDTSVPGLRLRTDTKTDIDDGEETAHVGFLRTIGVPLTVELDAEGNIVSASRGESTLDETVQAFGAALYHLSADAVRHHFGFLFSHATDRDAVRLNEPWTTYSDHNGPAMHWWLETERTLLEAKGSTARIALTGFVQFSEFEAGFPDPESAPLEPNRGGSYAWDLQDGSLIDAEITDRIAGEAELPGDASVRSSGTVRTVISRVDESFDLDEILSGSIRFERAEGPRPLSARNLDVLCAETAQENGIASVAAGAVTSEGVLAFGIAGVRDTATGVSVRTDDAYAIGLVSSNLLASVIGSMVSDGVLSWDAALPDRVASQVDPAFRSATLEQFLRNAAGVRSLGSNPLANVTGTAQVQRERALIRVLSSPTQSQSESDPVGAFTASMAAAVVIAEAAADEPWESLVATHLAGPLGMRTAHFGWPTTAMNREAPLGHSPNGRTPRPVDLSAMPPFDPFTRPSSGMSLSLEDMCRFASAELAALRDNGTQMSLADAQRIHDAQGGTRAMNWITDTLTSGLTIHSNTAVAGGFTVVIAIVPSIDLGVVVLTNTSNGLGPSNELARRLLKQDPRVSGRPAP